MSIASMGFLSWFFFVGWWAFGWVVLKSLFESILDLYCILYYKFL